MSKKPRRSNQVVTTETENTEGTPVMQESHIEAVVATEQQDAPSVSDVAEDALPIAEDTESVSDTDEVSESVADTENVPELASQLFYMSFLSDPAKAADIADLVARRTKHAVELRSGDALVYSVPEPSPKAKRVIALAIDTGERPATLAEAGSLSQIALAPVKVVTEPSAQQKRVIELCIRPQGASTADLYTTTASTKGVPWKDIVANCAKRFGYKLTVSTGEDRRVAYHLAPLADAEPASNVA